MLWLQALFVAKFVKLCNESNLQYDQANFYAIGVRKRIKSWKI